MPAKKLSKGKPRKVLIRVKLTGTFLVTRAEAARLVDDLASSKESPIRAECKHGTVELTSE